MRRLLTLRGWPLVPQLIVAAALLLVVALLALGSPNPELNPGMYLLWLLWWPALLLSFLAAGRIWCAVCPVSLLGDFADRSFSGRPASPSFNARLMVVFPIVSLATVHLVNLWFRFEDQSRVTGVLLAVLGAAALLLTLVFRGRWWCRALCPLGALGGPLTHLSPLRIAGAAVACPQECAGKPCAGAGVGRTLCPVLIDLRLGVDPGACILCGACLKACPRLGDVGWVLPGLDRFQASPAAGQSLAVLAFLGLAVDMALTHLADWPILFWRFSSALGIGGGAWVETALHVAIIVSPPVGALLMWRVRRPGQSLDARLAALAAPALPLAGAALLALTLRPLLVEGPLVLRKLFLVAGWEGAQWLGALRRLDGLPLRVVQEAVIAAGIVVALLAAGKWPGRGVSAMADEGGGRLPGVVFVVLVGATLFWICSRQMSG